MVRLPAEGDAPVTPAHRPRLRVAKDQAAASPQTKTGGRHCPPAYVFFRRVGKASGQNASSSRSIRSRVVFSMIRRSEPIRGRTSRVKKRAAATLPV